MLRKPLAVAALALLAAGALAQVTTPPQENPPTRPEQGSGGAADTPPPGPPLTVDEAVGIARDNAFGIRTANVNVNRQLGRLREIQAALGPTLGASANYTRNGRENTANFGGQPIVTGPLVGSTASLAFSIPIDVTGNLNRSVRAQRAALDAQRDLFTAAVNDNRQNVRRAYYNALRQQGLVGVSEQTVTNVQTQLRQAEAQFNEGLIARIDVERLRALLTQYQNELLINQNALNIAKQNVNQLLARPIETPFSLVPETAVPPIPTDEERLVAEGQRERPEARAITRQVETFSILRRVAQRTLEPSLAFSIQYQRNLNPAGFNGQQDTTFALFSLSIPLVDSGATRARVQQAQADEDGARINLDSTRLSIAQEVKTALTTLRTSQARLATATAQVGYATEVERIARVRRDAGEATYLEVTDAQTQLVQARNQLVSARYDFLTAYADLQRAIGNDDVTLAPGATPATPDAAAPRVGRFGDRTGTGVPELSGPPQKVGPANKGGKGEPQPLGETVPPGTKGAIPNPVPNPNVTPETPAPKTAATKTAATKKAAPKTAPEKTAPERKAPEKAAPATPPAREDGRDEPMMNLRLPLAPPLALLALASLLIAPGCVDRKAQELAKQTAGIVTDPVKVVTVERPQAQTLEDTVEVSGNVTTSEDVQASFKSPGRLAAVYVKDGDSVTQGQLVASLDTSTLQPAVSQAAAQVSTAQAQLQQAITNARLNPAKTAAGVSQAQAQVRSAQATLTKGLRGARPEEIAQQKAVVARAQADYVTTEKDRNRYSRLVKEGAISQQRLDQAINAFAVASANLNAQKQALAVLTNGTRREDITVAREGLAQAKQALATARANQSLDATYRSQVDAARGQVEAAQAQLRLVTQNLTDAQLKAPIAGRVLGKPLQPGAVVQAGASVARIIGSGGVYFQGEVPSAQLDQVRAGQSVRVRVDAIPGKVFTGRIESIAPQGETTGRLFLARIVFEGDASAVRPGMFARGTIVVRTEPNALTLPTSALQGSGDERFVYVNDGGKAKRQPVRTGIVKEDRTQVVGLAPDAPVIVRGGAGLLEGDKIRTEEPAANAQKAGSPQAPGSQAPGSQAPGSQAGPQSSGAAPDAPTR